MNGPEHYVQAEAWLTNALDKQDPVTEGLYLAHAQVHATLALAAATALINDDGGYDDWRAWKTAASVSPNK